MFHSDEKFRRESFTAAVISGAGKVWVRREEYQDFPWNIFCLSAEKFRNGILYCCKNFGCRKSLFKRGWGVLRIGIANKIGSWIKFDEMQTDIGICFPIHFVVFISLYEPGLTQSGSKSEAAKLLNNFCSSLLGILNASNLSRRVSVISKTFFGYICFTRSLQESKGLSRLPVSEKNVSQVLHREASNFALMLLT